MKLPRIDPVVRSGPGRPDPFSVFKYAASTSFARFGKEEERDVRAKMLRATFEPLGRRCPRRKYVCTPLESKREAEADRSGRIRRNGEAVVTLYRGIEHDGCATFSTELLRGYGGDDEAGVAARTSRGLWEEDSGVTDRYFHRCRYAGIVEICFSYRGNF